MLFDYFELYVCAARTSLNYSRHYLFDNVPRDVSDEYRRISDMCGTYSEYCFNHRNDFER